ncbi:hypothetical protein BT96DRAFT_918276 [Gymnopus androsaceus JB14]|uniref:F-box domain-containing protein n=1 Tax=Gymnopus androsaceus JB14 TaxID=1447944 RepID=A0A6A4HWK1_9AGAR|nr:hypothetical protein BT96DRAFT_918276 [Gymnopus androsaceus JB14]
MSKPAPLLCSACYSTLENIPIQGYDILRMRSANLSAKVRLPYCDYKISQIEKILKDLLKQRVEIEQFVNQSSSLLAPIRRLPPEILTEIFLLVWATRTDSDMGITVRHRKASGAVFPLSWVCSFWRDIIRSRGIFWSSFEIDLRCIGSGLPFGFKASPSLIKSFSRSQAAPMSLRLNFGCMKYILPAQIRLMTALNNSSKKWKDLHLDFTEVTMIYSHLPSRLLRQGTLDFSSLEKLTIMSEPLWPMPQESFYNLLPAYPRLRHFRTNVYRTTDKLDIRNITTLDLEVFIGTSITQLLTQCPLLETLQLHGFHSTINPENIIPDPPLQHSCLSELKLAFDGRFDRDAWQSLSLPRLTSLSLFYDIQNFNRINEVRMMLKFSQATLQNLYLYDFPEQTAIELIKDMPSLSRLYLSLEELSATIFNQMVISPNQVHIIIPNLSALSLEMDGTWSHGSMFKSSDEFLDACCRMVESRCKAVAVLGGSSSQGAADRVPLQELSLRLPYIPDDVITALLHKLKILAPDVYVAFN